MNHRKNLLIIAVISFLAVSCKSYYETLLNSSDTDLRYEGAFDYYNKGKFNKASELFEGLILVMQGTEREDTVQFYTALSNYKFGDYTTAESGFAKFIEVFPRSPFTEEAKYLRIKCLYEGTFRYELDPSPTKRALSIISEFMYENPDSPYYSTCRKYTTELLERLYKKSFESAKLYYKLEDYKAAHYALKNVLKENADNIYREDILYYTAMAAYKYALNSVTEKQKNVIWYLSMSIITLQVNFQNLHIRRSWMDYLKKLVKILN
jgi:outer membrane assembly lipoprotein YfiO